MTNWINSGGSRQRQKKGFFPLRRKSIWSRAEADSCCIGCTSLHVDYFLPWFFFFSFCWHGILHLMALTRPFAYVLSLSLSLSLHCHIPSCSPIFNASLTPPCWKDTDIFASMFVREPQKLPHKREHEGKRKLSNLNSPCFEHQRCQTWLNHGPRVISHVRNSPWKKMAELIKKKKDALWSIQVINNWSRKCIQGEKGRWARGRSLLCSCFSCSGFSCMGLDVCLTWTAQTTEKRNQSGREEQII